MLYGSQSFESARFDALVSLTETDRLGLTSFLRNACGHYGACVAKPTESGRIRTRIDSAALPLSVVEIFSVASVSL